MGPALCPRNAAAPLKLAMPGGPHFGYGHRDATMILVAYCHGLRASEVCGLRWDQI